MLNVLIVDDEPLARSRLTQQLAECGSENELKPVGPVESGLAALEFYSDWKTIYVDYSDRLQRAQIDTE